MADRVPRSVVVVGGGLAGSQAAAELRSQGFGGRVTLLGDEPDEPYDRPPLSKELLVRTEPAWLRDELGTDVRALVDDLRLNDGALSLHVGPRSVTVTARSGDVTADAAVLATGAHAILPAPWSAALTLHTTADAARLRTVLRPGARLVIIGAGWIGAEVAGVASAAGLDVTVVEAAGAPLAGALGPAVGRLTAPWYGAAGVRLLTDVAVVGVRPSEVELGDGRTLPADVVLAAVGARPSSDWLAGAVPLEADGSILVDEGYQVLGLGPHVVAVGDLARRRSRRHGWVPGGHWDGALRGPAIAVRSLLAGPDSPMTTHDDVAPYVFSTQLGHELGLYGQPGDTDDVVLRGDPAGPFSALWFTAGTDELTAVLAIGRPHDVGAARKLFSAPELPHLDRGRAADPATPLRGAQL
jgi:3-phenylpropionate/trans-cinnamate dioxygenase ferredoxin reductase subunit